MIAENTQENRNLKNVIASMAIEDMYLSENFVNELIKASRGEKTYTQLREDIIRKHARR